MTMLLSSVQYLHLTVYGDKMIQIIFTSLLKSHAMMSSSFYNNPPLLAWIYCNYQGGLVHCLGYKRQSTWLAIISLALFYFM
jgi:hypothetical protein